jgi:hypothetical protein
LGVELKPLIALHKSSAAFLRSDEVLVPPDAVTEPLIIATPSMVTPVIPAALFEPELRIATVAVAA